MLMFMIGGPLLSTISGINYLLEKKKAKKAKWRKIELVGVVAGVIGFFFISRGLVDITMKNMIMINLCIFYFQIIYCSIQFASKEVNSLLNMEQLTWIGLQHVSQSSI